MKPIYLMLCVSCIGTAVSAQDLQPDVELEVIEVTARKKVESLQDVPDAVTAFNRSEIESARITEVQDFADLTPNLVIRQGFRAGVSYITMRGVTTPQQGLPPVTFVVDGVQVGAMDFINQSLNQIERIEVLRGPQGALYGAGAMAGAINIVTQQPSEEWHTQFELGVAQGNDKTAKLSASGGLSENWFAQFNGNLQRSDGLIDSRQGMDLDFSDNEQYSTRWQYLKDDFSADIRLGYSDYDQGAIMQDLLMAPDSGPQNTDLDDYSAGDPDRGFIGSEQRKFRQGSLKLSYDFDNTQLSWISAFHKVDQHLLGDLDWSATPLFIQDLTDNFEVTSHEVRLDGETEGSNWLIGAYYQQRDGLNDLTIRLEPEVGVISDPIFSQVDVKYDKLQALFGQWSIDLNEQWELTLAGRYDKVNYRSTRYTNRDLQTLIPLRDTNGELQDTLRAEDSKFQPKVSLSYDINDHWMVYGTYAEGFRPGFYNSGNLTRAEFTENYELGFKSKSWQNRLQLNGAAFYIDYSDQQFSFIVAEPPFRVTSNIPNTKIRGLELEATAQLSQFLRATLAYGYLDAEVQDLNQQAPATPESTFNAGFFYDVALTADWHWQWRLDYRHQDSINLGSLVLPLTVGSKSYLDVSTSVENQNWRVTLYADNVTDELTATEASYVEGLLGAVTGVVRAYTPGRQVGVTVRYQF